MKTVKHLQTAIKKGIRATGSWLTLLHWLRLLVLSLTRIKSELPGKGFHEPAMPPKKYILLEAETKTKKLTTKLTSMFPAHRYTRWGFLFLFVFLGKFATAQTGPYQFTGNDDVCIDQTKNYGVTKVPGSTYTWTITPGTEGVDWNLTISDNTITVKWLKAGTYTISVIEINEYNCSSDAVQIQVTVHELPVCSITGPNNICPGSTNTYSAPSGTYTYSWSISGNATIPGATNGETVSVLANNSCGSYTLTLVITNANGCTSTCSQTYDITTPPVVLTAPADTIVSSCLTQAQVDAAYSDWLARVISSGGCTLVVTNDAQAAPPVCGGSVTVKWTAKSPCEVDVTKTATFTVTPATPVVITTPVATTVSACDYADQAALDAAFQAWLATASVTGGCAPVLTNNATGAGTLCTGGAVTVTFTATDLCESPTATATFTVTPATPVVIACPPPQTFCEVDSNSYKIPALVVTNNCGKDIAISYEITGATTRSGTGTDASGIFNVGVSTITWTVTDACGNISTCTTTVTINPLPAPLITGPDTSCVNTGTVTYSTPQVGCNTYNWTISEGGTIIGSSTGNSIVVQWTTAGTKTVTVTETMCGTGCSKKVSKDFVVTPKPITSPITHN
jgi:hypothetical protein